MLTFRRRVALLSLACSFFALTGTAFGDATYDDYSGDGSLTACKYSPSDLQNALNGAPSDIQQYDPGYLEALRRALDARASGACDPDGSNNALAGAAGKGKGGKNGSGGSAKGAGATTPFSVLDAGDLSQGGTPAWTQALAGAGGLLAVASLIFLIAMVRSATASAGQADGGSSRLADYWWGLRERFER